MLTRRLPTAPPPPLSERRLPRNADPRPERPAGGGAATAPHPRRREMGRRGRAGVFRAAARTAARDARPLCVASPPFPPDHKREELADLERECGPRLGVAHPPAGCWRGCARSIGRGDLIVQRARRHSAIFHVVFTAVRRPLSRRFADAGRPRPAMADMLDNLAAETLVARERRRSTPADRSKS